MATVSEPLLMTVERFHEQPPRDDVITELHWGQVVVMTRPKMKHAKLQSRLVRLLRPKAEHLGVVESEVAFRALAEYDLRGADVAFVTQERWDSTADSDHLQGSPELVIEVLSPSNTRRDMQEKATLCLATGAHEFWLVDDNQKSVTVVNREGSVAYGIGQTIPLTLFSEALRVSEIFT